MTPNQITEAADAFYPFVVNGEGTAKDTLDTLAATWVETLKSAGYDAK